MTRNVDLKLVEADLENVVFLEKLLFIFKTGFSRSAQKTTISDLKSGKTKYLFVYRGDEFVGVCGYKFPMPTLIETVKTVVLKEFRGQGLGVQISQAIENYCLENFNPHKIMTTIYSENTSMINIKLRQGYKVEGFHPDHEAIGFDEYCLGKVFK
jgi:RimJ/RimL family protein N-acetyltransferase